MGMPTSYGLGNLYKPCDHCIWNYTTAKSIIEHDSPISIGGVIAVSKLAKTAVIESKKAWSLFKRYQVTHSASHWTLRC